MRSGFMHHVSFPADFGSAFKLSSLGSTYLTLDIQYVFLKTIGYSHQEQLTILSTIG